MTSRPAIAASKRAVVAGVIIAAGLACSSVLAAQQAGVRIPLPEHPRPDFQRPLWQNLNGAWDFQFDKQDAGRNSGWQNGLPAPITITVPFPWGSALSGVPDSAQLAWYQRTIDVPNEWLGRRVFLVIGAADWHTTAWLDGQLLGTHQGGYTPFEFELKNAKPGAHQLVLRIDDVDRKFKLEGKQGYGNARGIWQTPYLEARGGAPLRYVHFTPHIDRNTVTVDAKLLEKAPQDLTFEIGFRNPRVAPVTRRVRKGADRVTFELPIAAPHLWSLEDPFLYDVVVSTSGKGISTDEASSYFGMREIGVANLPDSDISYVALNGKPVYLQLALDQAYHPDGFYTFPSDEFTRDEILRARQIGLNGLREHVKVETPRKLYWADRLGVLIMADVPNSWGEPDADMRREIESTLAAMIERDYNHPAIFAWIPFNETWGLFTKENGKEMYKPETQQWVASVVRTAKSLDATRLVEDNSVCCGRGHTVSDINSWHSYLPGWAWQKHLDIISDSTYAGSGWNFENGYQQAKQPNINSEFGNVWGYEGSTGDVDWSWDYHRAVDAFRKHPRVAGWLYTEHHDVINEWNGYWRFDRSSKETGFGYLVDGMTLNDLHAPLYIAVGDQLSQTVQPGQTITVPLFASFLSSSNAYGDSLRLKTELYGWNSIGQRVSYGTTSRSVPYRPYLTQPLAPVTITMPHEPAVVVFATRLEDRTGKTLQRNFTTFVIEGAPTELRTADNTLVKLVRIDPASFTAASWSLKQWNVLDGLKVNGAGAGYFEYHVPWPKNLKAEDVEAVSFVAEVSAKRLFGKDNPNAGKQEGDFMLGKGTHDPSLNRNAYPMTDEKKFPSAVTVSINGVVAGHQTLDDDPADSRGILSWHYQKQDRYLREAGSYGQLLQAAVPREAVQAAAALGEFVIRLEVPESLPGGLAIYGRRFGRYPLDPTLIFVPRTSAVASEPKE